MPNRYVRESAIESESVNALSWRTEVFYRRLINKVDDFGRYTANPSLIRAALFPLKIDEVSAADVAEMLKECQECGLLFVYEESGKAFLVMNKWEKGRAHKSEYPQPPANICELMQTYVYTSKHLSAYAPDSDSDSDTDSDTKRSRAKVVFPSALDSEPFKAAWGEWKAYRTQLRKPLKPITEEKQLNELSLMGVERAIAALNHSMKNGYQGIFEPSANRSGLPQDASKPVGGTTEAIIRQRELDEVTKQIASIRARDEHMSYSEAEKAKLKQLKVRQAELKAALGWKLNQ